MTRWGLRSLRIPFLQGGECQALSTSIPVLLECLFESWDTLETPAMEPYLHQLNEPLKVKLIKGNPHFILEWNRPI